MLHSRLEVFIFPHQGNRSPGGFAGAGETATLLLFLGVPIRENLRRSRNGTASVPQPETADASRPPKHTGENVSAIVLILSHKGIGQNHFGTDQVNSNTISQFGAAVGLEIEAKDGPIYRPLQFGTRLQLDGFCDCHRM